MIALKIEISARHVHLTRQDLDALFGDGYDLKKEKTLSQASDFAAEETISIEGAKGRMDNVRIVGPCRSYSQVELSATDCYKLGINAPVRLSGKIIGSASIKIIGPKGELQLKDGAIIAKRHIHMNPEDSAKLGVKNGQNVKLAIDGPRALIFDNVEVRVHESFNLAAHLDTDEANAAGIKSSNATGNIVV
ncbi:phosphate propanoyltransferase [Candidatus Falkowbacteria bacterium]|nr:phosphate propanoyltransferase [Candidatus Falkowbacteria bacterium]